MRVGWAGGRNGESAEFGYAVLNIVAHSKSVSDVYRSYRGHESVSAESSEGAETTHLHHGRQPPYGLSIYAFPVIDFSSVLFCLRGRLIGRSGSKAEGHNI